MATVTKILSNKVDGENNSQIYFRVNVTRTARFRIGSGIFIPRNRWNETNGEIRKGDLAVGRGRFCRFVFQDEDVSSRPAKASGK